jgi:hypothetical protein
MLLFRLSTSAQLVSTVNWAQKLVILTKQILLEIGDHAHQAHTVQKALQILFLAQQENTQIKSAQPLIPTALTVHQGTSVLSQPQEA